MYLYYCSWFTQHQNSLPSRRVPKLLHLPWKIFQLFERKRVLTSICVRPAVNYSIGSNRPFFFMEKKRWFFNCLLTELFALLQRTDLSEVYYPASNASTYK